MIADWFNRNVRAMVENPAVRLYAAILSVGHALTGVSWFTYRHIGTRASGEDGLCSPFVPQCGVIRSHLSPDAVRTAVVAYMVLGLGAAVLFLLRRRQAAPVTFLAAALVGTGLYSLDYRLRSNEVYMLSWSVLVLLVAPRKAQALQALVACFYVWAATLKLNWDWMTGASLYARPYLVPQALVPAACVYVLFLELVLLWGLFASSAKWRWAVYAQLLLFHAVSWRVVGYYYPLLMFGILTIYPLVWRLSPADALTWPALRAHPTLWRTVTCVAAVFSSFQVVPFFFPGDPAITGEGRWFALHMFDGRVLCQGGATIRGEGGQSMQAAVINERQTERLRCDPIDLLAQVRKLCRKAAASPGVVGIDVAIDARRQTEARMQPLMHIDDFCSKSIEYSPWHHNEWIGVAGE